MKKSIFIVQSVSLLVLLQLTALAWDPPIGIPRPEFGIEETYRMYDDPANRNPELIYTQNAEGGCYTHYVDWSAPNATDSGNTYGSMAIPRKTIPQNLPKGSIVEVQDNTDLTYTTGGLPYGNRYVYLTGTGTKEHPIFIRGVDSPVFYYMYMQIGGSYIVVEGFDIEYTTIGMYSKYTPQIWDHTSIRNNEIHGNRTTSGQMCAITKGSYHVVYNNHIHHNGWVPQDMDRDVHGATVTGDATHVWIVDNDIHHNDGDAIQIMGNDDVGLLPEYIYIGRNALHEDRENAIDLKYSRHVIASENDIYGYNMDKRVYGADPDPRIPFGSDATALLPSNENGRLSWFIFNDIHDCIRAIRIDDELDDYDHTVYIVNNLIYNIDGQAFFTYNAPVDEYIVGNVIYNVGAGYWSYKGTEVNEGNWVHHFYNNIFCKINGGFSDSHRTYPDDYINIQNRTSAEKSFMGNNLFYDGGGYHWGEYYDYNDVATLYAAEYQGADSIETNPIFTDSDNNDFSLQAGSPAINAGTSSGVVKEVFDTFQQLYGIDIRKDIEGGVRPYGAEWDMGAYEWGSTPADPDQKPDPEPDTDTEPAAEPDSFIPDVTALLVMNNIIKTGGNQSALIRCDMKEQGKLIVKIYDAKGKEIITVCDEQREAGRHEFVWSGQDSAGRIVGSGIYIVHMQSEGYTETKKIAVVK